MNLAVILGFIKAFLPKTKIGAAIGGMVVVVIGFAMSADPKEILVKMCASELPPLPVIEAPVAPSPAPVKK